MKNNNVPSIQIYHSHFNPLKTNYADILTHLTFKANRQCISRHTMSKKNLGDEQFGRISIFREDNGDQPSIRELIGHMQG